MSTNFTSENDPTLNATDSSVFAPVPAWERNKKRGMFGGRSRVAAEPRTFDEAPTTLSDDARVYEARMDATDPVVGEPIVGDSVFAGTPIYANRPARKGNGAAPIAIAAGVILLGGLAAAGWYASQPHDQGVAQLTPGATTTTTVASSAADSTLPQGPSTAQVAQNTTPPAVTHSRTVTTTSRAPAASSRTTVTRTAPPRAAADNAANASAVAPAPQAAPAAPPASAAPAPALKLDLPPAAPTTSAPAEAPAAPQTVTPTPPTTTPPTV